jgi:Cd2+/Zn2+-exporting ATPase
MLFTLPKGQEARPHLHHPVFFEEFFDLGLDEAKSPFLTPGSRLWGQNLPLKGALIALLFLIAAYSLYYTGHLPLSHAALLVVFFIVGTPALIESLEDLAQLDVNIDILMTLAAFSSVFIGSGLEGGLLLVLFALSGAMEEAVTEKARSAINSLSKLAPTTALVQTEDGSYQERSVKDLKKGMKILIKAGQVVPIDGKVLEGSSSLNLAHITGESLPQAIRPGQEITAGAENIEGSLLVIVTKKATESLLSKIIRLVTEAQAAKPKLQQAFDNLSRTYALTIIFLSINFFLTFPYVFDIPFFGDEGSLYRSLAFLIAASPCALIIAIPTAYLSAISCCAKNGILLKGGVTLDAFANCHAIAFDKTGTLTAGTLSLLSIEPLVSSEKDTALALSIAYSLEQNAMHPMADSIIKQAKAKSSLLCTLRDFISFPGKGLAAKAYYNNKWVDVAIGGISFVEELTKNTLTLELKKKIEYYREQGELLSLLMIEDELYLFRFQDTLRPSVNRTLTNLKKLGLHLVMLTGDHHFSARRVAKEMGIEEYYADLKPEDKLTYVGSLNQKMGLAMVGDGINDAPALARATVGIGMGQMGSNAAIEASDIVLLQDNIDMLDWLMSKARQTKWIVRENLILATTAILLASIPALMGYLPLWLAVILHEGGTVLVGLNALRLLKK